MPFCANWRKMVIRMTNDIFFMKYLFFLLFSFNIFIPQVYAGVLDSIADFPFVIVALVMGSIDGFNVCSLGALILIISLVLVFKSRKLILIAGLSFIATTVIVYGLLIFLWYRIFIYISPFKLIFEFILGAIALFGALYFLKVFINAIRFGPTCSSNNSPILNWAVVKVESAFNKGGYWAIFSGVVLFALIVAIIEFPCSAALPLAFVGIITDAGTPFILFLIYIAIYLFMYMLMEVIVFLVAFFGKKIWVASPKLVTISAFLGSLVLFAIAVQYLFKIPILTF